MIMLSIYGIGKINISSNSKMAGLQIIENSNGNITIESNENADITGFVKNTNKKEATQASLFINVRVLFIFKNISCQNILSD